MTPAEALLRGLPVEIVIADKVFDADAFRARLAAHGIVAGIPSNRSRARPIAHHPDLYNDRHRLENVLTSRGPDSGEPTSAPDSLTKALGHPVGQVIRERYQPGIESAEDA